MVVKTVMSDPAAPHVVRAESAVSEVSIEAAQRLAPSNLSSVETLVSPPMRTATERSMRAVTCAKRVSGAPARRAVVRGQRSVLRAHGATAMRDSPLMSSVTTSTMTVMEMSMRTSSAGAITSVAQGLSVVRRALGLGVMRQRTATALSKRGLTCKSVRPVVSAREHVILRSGESGVSVR